MNALVLDLTTSECRVSIDFALSVVQFLGTFSYNFSAIGDYNLLIKKEKRYSPEERGLKDKADDSLKI